jgi:hypothetical protein
MKNQPRGRMEHVIVAINYKKDQNSSKLEK